MKQIDDQDEEELDEDLQRYWDLWGLTYSEQQRLGACLLVAAAVIVVVALACLCFYTP